VLKNIIIVGDSFCTTPNFWPRLLAKSLDMNLINFGLAGGSWWSVKSFLERLSPEHIDNCEIIVFVHTNAQRIPTTAEEINQVNFSNLESNNESNRAIGLYYKYIHNEMFLSWAQLKWFEEINHQWDNIKVVHLFSFPQNQKYVLNGMKVSPSLAAISLDEIASKDGSLVNDKRPNHLSRSNNNQLAQQLFQLISNYQIGEVNLDISKFNLLSNQWIQKWN
jgi:hypothetical protein